MSLLLKSMIGLIGKMALKSVIKVCGMKVIREWVEKIVFPALDKIAADDSPETEDFDDILVKHAKKAILMALENLEK